MVKRENLSVKIDYLSIVFDTLTAKDLIDNLLHLSMENFIVQDTKIAYKKYTKLYQFGSIKVFGDNPKNEANILGLGCYLVLGGKGCDALLTSLQKNNRNYVDFFRECNTYIAKDSYHLTRLDIAIDDKNDIPYFTIEQIRKKCINREFISSCKEFKYHAGSFLEGTADTVYIGNKKSSISFRFYDKDKEMAIKQQVPYNPKKSWKRTEIQLRDKMAHNFTITLINNNDNDIGNFAFNLLSSYLRFVKKDKHQTNKSRWPTCTFWNNFLGDIKPLKLKIELLDNNLKDTQKWLEHGGAMSAIKAFAFLEHYNALGNLKSIQEMTKFNSYSPSLSSKIVAHLHQLEKEELIPLIYEDTRKSH